MTPAELRTAHDSLGVTADFLAERTGLHVNMIWRYELYSRKSDVPEEVAEIVRDLQNDMDCAVERLAEELLDAEELPRYVEPEDYWMAVPELNGWPRESQGLVLSRVSAAIMNERGDGTAPPIRYR